MKNGIFTKLMLIFISIISLSFVTLATVLSYWFQMHYFDSRLEKINNQSIAISMATEEYVDGVITLEEFEDNIKMIGEYLEAEIWIVDLEGEIYAVSESEREYLIGENLGEFLENEDVGKYKSIYEGYVDNFEEVGEMYSLEIDLNPEDGESLGTVIVHTPLVEIMSSLKQVYTIIWISALVVIIVSTMIIYLFVQRSIVKPISILNNAARDIASGGVGNRVNITTGDEMEELGYSFNIMANSLEQVEERRRSFVSDVSHEIRSPITSINGFLEGMLDGVVPKEKHNHYLKITYTEVQRLKRLVNELLDLSALEAGQFSQVIDKVNLDDIIKETTLQFENRLEDKKIKLDVKISQPNIEVYGDEDRLKQVFTNLIDNAMKYTPKQGKIRIHISSKGKSVTVEIANNGPKIDEDDIGQIWQRFYRADKARSRKESTGLGLPIVRGIIASMNEVIWAENKDGWVTFTFTLTKIKD